MCQGFAVEVAFGLRIRRFKSRIVDCYGHVAAAGDGAPAHARSRCHFLVGAHAGVRGRRAAGAHRAGLDFFGVFRAAKSMFVPCFCHLQEVDATTHIAVEPLAPTSEALSQPASTATCHDSIEPSSHMKYHLFFAPGVQ